MNNIKNSFSIQDLEVLSGIKAHTIRIWEKRYNLLNPKRLNRNIRLYGLSDLQKILNISVLSQEKQRISEIAKLTDRQLEDSVKAISNAQVANNYYINSLIVSMFSLDEELFQEIYDEQIEKTTFEEIFTNTYLPLLQHIGVLWQTGSITPSHEHFISNLIYQKIVLNSANLSTSSSRKSDVFVLFLPESEIHEIGLLFLNYYLKSQGNKVIYLGRDVPFEDLYQIKTQLTNITWVTSFLIDRTLDKKDEFLNQVNDLLTHTKNKFWIIGKIWDDEIQAKYRSENIQFYSGFENIIHA